MGRAIFLPLGALRVKQKIRPDDWDRLFTPNAPRRGPLRVPLNLFITLIVIVLLAVGVLFARNLREQRIAQALATATSAAATAIPERTAAAQAQLDATATLVAARTATAVAQPVAPCSPPARSTVATCARRRSAAGRSIGLALRQIVQLLEKSDDGSWFKISYNAQRPDDHWLGQQDAADDRPWRSSSR
ncbi:MAG: hypothetical protein U0Z44_20690 [Kouleothrix sp.]